jgi:predicted secreted protein
VKRFTSILAVVLSCASAATSAVAQADTASTPQPVVTLTATASSAVPNDRMQVWLRAEAENADPARAASEVNGKMARAIARAKAQAGVDVATPGYSTYPVYDKEQRPARWRAAQTLSLESSDFAALAALATALQADAGLLVSGVNFSVAPATRRKEEDALTEQAIRQWQQRAVNVARSFAAPGWRTGRVTVQTNDYARPQPMMRGAAMAQAAPIVVEGGSSDVTVTITGEAILDSARAAAR